jgi:DNA-directed RNA polymerase subunit RPC12/RpoP
VAVNIPLPHSDATLTTNTPCITCGYNLRGLRRDGSCPECGLRIAMSLRTWRFNLLDRKAVRRTCRGLLLLATSASLIPVSVFVLFEMDRLIGRFAYATIAAILLAILHASLIVGIGDLTHQDRRAEAASAGIWAWMHLGAAVYLWLVGQFPFLTFRNEIAAVLIVGDIVLIAVCWIAMAIRLTRPLVQLARDLNLRGLDWLFVVIRNWLVLSILSFPLAVGRMDLWHTPDAVPVVIWGFLALVLWLATVSCLIGLCVVLRSRSRLAIELHGVR